MEVSASGGVLGVFSSVFHCDILSRGVGGGASSFSWSSMSWVTKAPAPRVPPHWKMAMRSLGCFSSVCGLRIFSRETWSGSRQRADIPR